jgi:hypothetical protein
MPQGTDKSHAFIAEGLMMIFLDTIDYSPSYYANPLLSPACMALNTAAQKDGYRVLFSLGKNMYWVTGPVWRDTPVRDKEKA